MYIKLRHYIDSAHRLDDSEDLVTKKCTNLHGHTYAIEVELSSPIAQSGLSIDFRKLKDLIDILDHRYINDVFIEQGFIGNTTAENIALFLFQRLQLPNVTIHSVSVAEGYKGDDKTPWVRYKGE